MMKLDKNIRKELNATGLPWQLEPAKGHYKIRLAGRLAGVISVNPCPNPRAKHNSITQIRRLAANIKGDTQ